jgi:Concanavalin A-like lectin/glucanases superfamily
MTHQNQLDILCIFKLLTPKRIMNMNKFNLLTSCTLLVLIVFLAACGSDSDSDDEQSTLKKGLVAHYSFKDGVAEDLSGNDNDGVITGAESEDDQDDRENESMEFDSEEDLILVNSPSFLDNDKGTFAAWVKFDDLTHTQYLASVGDNATTDHYMSFIRVDGTDQTIGIYWRQVGEANWLKSTVTVTTGVYYHMVLVSDGSQFKIYLDGEEIALNVIQGANNGKWIQDISGLDNFVIGNSVLLPPYTIPYLSGNLDEVRLYNRALTEQEILKLYTSTR